MKKLLAITISLILCVCLIFGLVACGGNNGSNGNNDSGNNVGGNDSVNRPPVTLQAPTAAEIVSARNTAASQTVQGYDFNLTFTGNFSVLGLGTSLSGKYTGAYRYDSSTDDVKFKRTTSGTLLSDSTCYVFTSGDNRIKATMDGTTVKKLSVEIPEEQNITMVNLPIVAIVDAVRETNISNIKTLQNSQYAYSCQIAMDGRNPVYAVLGNVFERLGTGVSFKGIDLSGNVSTLEFNLKDDTLNDFHLSFKMKIDVKGVDVTLNIDYSQKSSSVAISLPNTANSGILYNTLDVQNEVSVINSAIEDLKDAPVYSLDFTAENNFDPGWNKLAIVDSYTARMYKNTSDDIDWFNHSYYYKAHSEADGRETYKYTLGNVNGTDEDNQGTWLISRKSTNTQTRADGITADTQFDFLTSMVKLQANEIDCIKKQIVGNTVTYSVYLGKTATKSIQEKILGVINTNSYGDVLEVNNYFNTDNIIKNAEIEIVIKDGKIDSVACDIELCYNPTGGEYTEYNITLNNVIKLEVNKNLANAQRYVAPTKVKGTLGWGKNLNDAEYYIL